MYRVHHGLIRAVALGLVAMAIYACANADAAVIIRRFAAGGFTDPPDWCNATEAAVRGCWQMDTLDPSPNIGRCGGTASDCDLEETSNNPTIDSSVFVEDPASTDFTRSGNKELKCTDANCGGSGKLDFVDEDFTICLWHNIDSGDNSEIRFIRKYQSSANYRVEWHNSNGLRCRVSTGTVKSANWSGFTRDDNWHYLCCVQDESDSEMELFHDGVVKATKTGTGIADGTGNFQIGDHGYEPDHVDFVSVIQYDMLAAHQTWMGACMGGGTTSPCACDGSDFGACDTNTDCGSGKICSTHASVSSFANCTPGAKDGCCLGRYDEMANSVDPGACDQASPW